MALTCDPHIPADLPKAESLLPFPGSNRTVLCKIGYGLNDWSTSELLNELNQDVPELQLFRALILDATGRKSDAFDILTTLASSLPPVAYLLAYADIPRAEQLTWLTYAPLSHPLVAHRSQQLTQGHPHKPMALQSKIPDGVDVHSGFLSAIACAYLRWTALPWLSPARALDPNTGKAIPHPVRTNQSMAYSSGLACPFVMWLERQIANIAGISAACQENTGILHYSPGQQFKAHFDCFDVTQKAGASALLADGGQRTTTVLVYLNDDFEGGETYFPRKQWQFKGSSGDLLLFSNTDSEGIQDPSSLHQGKPTIKGQKWVLSKWIRQHPTDYGQRLHRSV